MKDKLSKAQNNFLAKMIRAQYRLVNKHGWWWFELPDGKLHPAPHATNTITSLIHRGYLAHFCGYPQRLVLTDKARQTMEAAQ